MKISCEEAAQICDKSQYKEASFWDIVKLRFHVWYCKTCKKYTRKNSKLTTLCNQSKLSMLSDEEKKCMKRDLEKRI